MIEARKCVRCGCMYISESEVCGKCEKKDGADLHKLKGFFLENGCTKLTQRELAIETGISDRNLARFLGYDEFKGMVVNEKAIPASGNVEELNQLT